MVGAANDVGDAHFDVVDNSAEVIGGQGGPSGASSGRAQENEILDLVVLRLRGDRRRRRSNRVVSPRGHAKTNGRTLIGGGGLTFAARTASDAPCASLLPAAGIVRCVAARVFFRRAVAEIGGACGQQLFGSGAISGQALRIGERPFIPVEAEPAQPVEDAFDEFRTIAIHVGVFDSKNKGATADCAQRAS